MHYHSLAAFLTLGTAGYAARLQLALPLLALLAAVTPAMAAPQSPTTIDLDFEDLSGSDPVPAGYGTVADWGSWNYYDAVDPFFPAPNGVTRIYPSALQEPIVFSEGVIFEGANVTTAVPFTWKLYLKGQLVHTSSVLAPNAGGPVGGPAVWHGSGYAGLIDSLEHGSTVSALVVDDFRFVSGINNDPGSNFCMTNGPNSAGTIGVMSATGLPIAGANTIQLVASGLPLNQFGMFVTSRTKQFATPPIAISNGNLCLGGIIGRFNGPGQIKSTGASGQIDLFLDMRSIPEGPNIIAAAPGDTWNFQVWYRDGVGLGSDFTDGYEIDIQ